MSTNPALTPSNHKLSSYECCVCGYHGYDYHLVTRSEAHRECSDRQRLRRDRFVTEVFPALQLYSVPIPHGVSLTGDDVVKTQAPPTSRRERLRTLAGSRVGLATGLFVVPEIRSFDDEHGTIVFERLRTAALRPALADHLHGVELVGRVARALAAIHRDLQTERRKATASGGITAIGAHRETVPLHGDFGILNVLLLPASDRIAIIDWANADWTGVDTDLGAPEIDLAVFLISLFHRRMFDSWHVSHRYEIARHFLATYASASPHGLDIETLSAIVAAATPRFNQLTRRRKGRLRALGHRHGMIDLRFFLRRLSQEDLTGA
jgi:hypothetical protein